MTMLVGCEPLEDRRLLSATLDVSGVLYVIGTSGPDVVGIREDLANGKWRVGINTDAVAKFDIVAVKSIQIDLGDGNDRLDFAGTLGFYCICGLGDETI